MEGGVERGRDFYDYDTTSKPNYVKYYTVFRDNNPKFFYGSNIFLLLVQIVLLVFTVTQADQIAKDKLSETGTVCASLRTEIPRIWYFNILNICLIIAILAKIDRCVGTTQEGCALRFVYMLAFLIDVYLIG